MIVCFMFYDGCFMTVCFVFHDCVFYVVCFMMGGLCFMIVCLPDTGPDGPCLYVLCFVLCVL